MGSVLAELLVNRGASVTLVTPAPVVASWAVNTLEQGAVHARLLHLGVTIVPHTTLTRLERDAIVVSCAVTGREQHISVDSIVLVTERYPVDSILSGLTNDPAAVAAAGIESIRSIGDCLAPGTVAAAVYSGHLAAREMDGGSPLPKRERLDLN